MNAPTTTFVTVPTEGMPAVIPLPAGSLACMTCGVSVAPPYADVESFGSSWKDLTPGRPKDGHTPISAVMLTRCAHCLTIRDRAEMLLDAHPAVQQAIGARSIALHQVESAMAGLDALDSPAAASVRTDQDLRLLIEHMTVPGAGTHWSRQFAFRTYQPGTAPQTCASARWAHLTDEQRQVLRDGLGKLLRARVDHPRAYAPPADTDLRGCLFCGVGTVEALPSRSHEAWTRESVSPRVIGGPHGTETITGYLCPTCDRAVDEAGSLGPSAMERSVRLQLGIRQTGYTTVELDGVVGWGTLPGAAPNSRPWEHLGDVEEVRRLYVG